MNADWQTKPWPVELTETDKIVLEWAIAHWHDARATWWEHRDFYRAEFARSHKAISLPKSKAA